MVNDFNTTIYYYVIPSSVDKELYNTKITLLPQKVKQKIESCKNLNKKMQSFFAWLLVDKIFADFGYCLNSSNLYYNENGKPIIDNINFNITHTNGLVSVAISNKSVGVDAEIIKDKRVSLSSTFFTESEIDYINGSESETFYQKYLEIWTKKEAVIKANGYTIAKDFKNALSNIDNKITYNIKTFNVLNKYVISVAYLDNNVTIKQINNL